MGTTTNHSLRYPEDAQAVAVPADVKKLADDVDAKLVSTAGGTVSGNVAFTGETAVQTPTANNHATTKLYVDNADSTLTSSISAINTELGTNPSGTYSTVKDRLDDIVSTVLAANGKTRVTHPNTNDVLVETWDATQNRWQLSHYDTGLRDVTSLTSPFTGHVYIRRIGYTVYASFEISTNAGGTYDIYDLPSGFRPHMPYSGRAMLRSTVSGVGANSVQPIWYAPNYRLTMDFAAPASEGLTGGLSFDTIDAVPGSLPGSLVSAAPY